MVAALLIAGFLCYLEGAGWRPASLRLYGLALLTKEPASSVARVLIIAIACAMLTATVAQSHLDLAAKYLSRALELRPSEATALVMLGLTRLKQGRLMDAESSVRQAIKVQRLGDRYELYHPRSDTC